MDKKGLKLAQALLQMSCWTQNYRTRKSTAKLVYNGKLMPSRLIILVIRQDR